MKWWTWNMKQKGLSVVVSQARLTKTEHKWRTYLKFVYHIFTGYIRVVHSSHFQAIFDSFSISFLTHFQWFGSKLTKMMTKMMLKMTWKMATVNTLKRKHFENDNKMHFTSLRQSSAHSNSTSRDFVKLFIISSSSKQATHHWDI